MASFIHNGRENLDGLQLQNQRHKIFNIRTSFLNLKLKIIRLAQEHKNTRIVHELSKTAIFIFTPMKNIYSSLF